MQQQLISARSGWPEHPAAAAATTQRTAANLIHIFQRSGTSLAGFGARGVGQGDAIDPPSWVRIPANLALHFLALVSHFA
jgi:hypothetical protein